MKENPTILTIGHSTLQVDDFIGRLLAHHVEAVADVRSRPFSRLNPQFNRPEVRRALEARGIRYVFMGAELGARSEDAACYVGDKVQYDLLAETPLFQSGLDRVIEGADKYRIALMCAEKKPLDCHRTILVARHLEARGYSVAHILEDGSVESHQNIMEELLLQLGMATPDMFQTPEGLQQQAYRIQGERIAYDRSLRQSTIGSFEQAGS